MKLAVGMALALTPTWFAACASTPATPSQHSAAAPTTRPTGPLPIGVGMAPPGSWTTTAFEPTLTFSVNTDGWMFFFQDDDDEMAVGKSGDIEVTAGRVGNVVDPTSHKDVPAPDDLVAWLASHPALDSRTPQPATVGGIDGRSIEVTNTGGQDVDIFAYPTGNLRVSADTRARFWVLPYEGPDLVFSGLAPEASFDDALPDIQSIVDSMEIGQR
jgi:hypothetical protein